MLLQFSDQTFSDNYVSTIGVDFKIRTIDLNGKSVKLQIWDTAGQERFQSITANYYHGSNAIAIVYDITDRKTFDNLKKWFTQIDNLATPGVCKLLVGNKADLENKRAVTKAEGEAFAANLGIPFIETSAKTAYNVSTMFTTMCSAIIERQGSSINTNQNDPWSHGPSHRVQGGGCPC